MGRLRFSWAFGPFTACPGIYRQGFTARGALVVSYDQQGGMPFFRVNEVEEGPVQYHSKNPTTCWQIYATCSSVISVLIGRETTLSASNSDTGKFTDWVYAFWLCNAIG